MEDAGEVVGWCARVSVGHQITLFPTPRGRLFAVCLPTPESEYFHDQFLPEGGTTLNLGVLADCDSSGIIRSRYIQRLARRASARVTRPERVLFKWYRNSTPFPFLLLPS